MAVVLHEKNIAIPLLVTWTMIICISFNAENIQGISSSTYVDRPLLECIPSDLKNFSRTIVYVPVKQVTQVTDEGYFIPLETGAYYFRIYGGGVNPFTDLSLKIEGIPVAKNFSSSSQRYLVQFNQVNLTKGHILQLTFKYAQHVHEAIPVSFSFNSGLEWTNIWDQLVRCDPGEDVSKHLFFGDWSSWMPCEKTCGELGKKTRHRVCAKDPLLLSIKINYTSPSSQEDKSCLAKTSCSGVLYTLSPTLNCSAFCRLQNRVCASEGHDLPNSSAILVFEALGEVCQSNIIESYVNNSNLGIDEEGKCNGFKEIPDRFNCSEREFTGKVVCPCAPLPVPPTINSVEQLNSTAINVSLNYSTDNPRLPYYRTFGIRLSMKQGQRIDQHKDFSINTWMVFSGLAINGVYCIETRSYYVNLEEGNASPCYFFTMKSAPSSSPPNINATGYTQTALNVDWDALDSANGSLTTYSVYVSIGGNLSASVNTTDTNVSVAGLQIFTTYCVQVSAWNVVGEGPLSDCFNATTLQGVPLSAPGHFAFGNVMATIVLLVWSPILPDHNQNNIEGWRVYYIQCDQLDLTPHQKTLYGSNQKQVNITDWIEPFTCYSFRMAGFTPSGEGPYTEWINTTTNEGAPIVAPGSRSYEQLNMSTVNITWQTIRPVDANGVIRGYIICLWDSSSMACNRTIITCPESLHKVINNLILNKNYCFKIGTFTAAGDGPLSECLNVLVEAAPSGFPQNISARNISSTSISIHWGQVDTGLQNGIIQGYRVFWKEMTANQMMNKTVNGETTRLLEVTMLKKFTRYCVKIQAYTSKGNGPFSPCVYVTTDEDVPSMAPTNVHIVNTTSKKIDISCSPIPAEHLNGFLLGYNVNLFYNCVQNPQKEEVDAVAPISTTGTLMAVLVPYPHTCYTLSLSAFTRIGEGNISQWINATTLDEAPSGVPQGISAYSTSSTSFNITWNEIPQYEQNGVILGYRIFYTGYSGARSNLSKTVNASMSLEITRVAVFSSYCVQVLGYNRKGNGPLSPCVNVTTDEACEIQVDIHQNVGTRPSLHVPSRAPNVLYINTTAKLTTLVWEALPEIYHHGVLLSYRILRKNCFSSGFGYSDAPPDVEKYALLANPATCYLCRMCANNRIGCGVKSEWQNCSTPEGVPDASPERITASGSGTTWINITWGDVPASQQNGVILGYRISWKESSSNQNNRSQTVDKDTFSLHIEGLKEYTSYCIQVLAFTKVGDGTISACVDVKTAEDVPKEPPSNVIGRNLSSTSLEMNWLAPAMDSLNGELLGYIIHVYRFNLALHMVSPPVSLILTCPYSSSKVIEGLNVGLLFCVKVAAFNKMGLGNFSNCSMVKLNEELPSSHPRKIKILDKTATSFRVTWNSIYWTNRNGIILGYTLIIKPYYTTTTTEIPPSTEETTNSTTETTTNLLTGATTESPTVNTSTAATVSSSTAQSTIPTAPANSLATTAPLAGRRRRRSVDSEMVINVGPDVFSYEVTNLDKNTEYCVQLFGFNLAGGGRRSDCVLSTTFSIDNIIPQLTLRSGSSSVQVDLNITDFNKLVSSGFLTHYEVQYKITSVSGIPVEDGVFKSQFFNATTQTLILEGLSQYTSYIFQAAVITNTGTGPFSSPVIIETCHCPNIFYTNWYVNPPFTKLKSNNQISGIIPSILDDVLRSACKYCDLNNGSAMIDYYYDQHGNRENMKNNTNAMTANITSSTHISFPLTQRNKELKYQGTYMPLLYIPGLLIVSRNESSVERYARVVAGSIYDIWPVIVINMVTTLLAGTIIWLLERADNSEQFPVSTLKGIGEGAWWAFITMTTLGYGDRVPVTRAGRIFAIIWALVGISISSIMIGSLCSTLTVTVVEEFSAGVGRGITIGVVALTPVAEVADEVSRGRATVKTFPTIEELVTAQRTGEIDNIIVDHFTAISRTDLFNGTWYKISGVINQPYTYGVLLNGEATKLERYFKEYSAANVAKVVELANMVDKSEKANETEPVHLIIVNEAVNFLDPSSSIFGTTFLVLGLTLLFFFLCGLSYHYLVTTKKRDLELVCRYRQRLEVMRSHLEEFYSHVCHLNSEFRTKHSNALRQVLVQEKKQNNKTSSDVSYVH